MSGGRHAQRAIEDECSTCKGSRMCESAGTPPGYGSTFACPDCGPQPPAALYADRESDFYEWGAL